MIRRESERHAKPLRELSARLLEDQLKRLAGANGTIERRLGPGLHAMSGQRLYRRLGFVRLGDYLTERLGMSLRRCQSIVRCERALTRLPAVAAAFDTGELSLSRMRTIVDVATPETQELWLARARRFTVRDLAAAARTARRELAPPPGDEAQISPGSEGRTPPGLEGPPSLGSQDATASSPEYPTSPGSEGPPSPGPEGQILPASEPGASATAPDSEAEDVGVNIMFRAPARVVALWHWALDLVRRSAGHQEPAWRCVEYLAAEFLSGAPHETALPTEGGVPGPTAPGVPKGHDPRHHPGEDDSSAEESSPAGHEVPDALIWSEATAAARDALRPLGHSADPDVILTRRSVASNPAPRADDPWYLDAHLRGLIRLRQSLAWRQGRLLAVVASRGLHLELGAGSFGEWCETVLGISPRRARYLISLDRRIRRLPMIADAYRRGLISWCQARHLVRVATPETEGRWVRFARQVTVRRLEDAVTRADIDAVPTPPAPGAAMSSQQPADPPRHTSAPTLCFNDQSMCGATERADRRIAFWVPTDVAGLWREALAACRHGENRGLDDWQCLIIMIDSLRRTWAAPTDRGWKRRYRIFERDGWRCVVPGCTSRANLNVHHIVFRSRGGGSKDPNLVTLCVAHHQRGIHAGQIRCAGTAPDDLWWELGLRPSGPPLLRCRGDRIVRGGRPIEQQGVRRSSRMSVLRADTGNSERMT